MIRQAHLWVGGDNEPQRCSRCGITKYFREVRVHSNAQKRALGKHSATVFETFYVMPDGRTYPMSRLDYAPRCDGALVG